MHAGKSTCMSVRLSVCVCTESVCLCVQVCNSWSTSEPKEGGEGFGVRVPVRSSKHPVLHALAVCVCVRERERENN